MPIYTYRCSDCGHQFERRQRMSEAPLSECPVCVGNVRRVVNNVGIVFKGSGFYETDNRGGKSKNGSGKNSSSKAVSTDKKSSSDSGGKESKSKEKAGTAA